MARVKTAPTMYNADDVWAAAVTAQRINGGYDKFGTESKPSNRSLMLQALEKKHWRNFSRSPKTTANLQQRFASITKPRLSKSFKVSS